MNAPKYVESCVVYAHSENERLTEHSGDLPRIALPELRTWSPPTTDLLSREDVLDMVHRDILDGRLPARAHEALGRLEKWCKSLGGGDWMLSVDTRWVRTGTRTKRTAPPAPASGVRLIQLPS